MAELRAGADDEKTFGLLDRAFGGDWWRGEFLAAAADGDPSGAAEHLARSYQRRTASLTGCRSWLVPVRRRPTHRPVYYLLYFTRHSDGVWAFGEALSTAQREWRRVWPLTDQATRTASELESGQTSLIPLEELLDDDGVEKRLEAEWVQIIATNLEELQSTHGAFRVGEHQLQVYGTTLGLAREKHVRAAIQRLHAAQKTGCDGRGQVQHLVVAPTTLVSPVPLTGARQVEPVAHARPGPIAIETA